MFLVVAVVSLSGTLLAMGVFVYYTATSANGFIADERGSLQWLFDVGGDSPDSDPPFLSSVGAQVMGSSTYEWLLANADGLTTAKGWREVFGGLPTRVFTSRSLPRPDAASIEFWQGDVEQYVGELRSLAGARDVWVVGGGDLAGQFFDAGALDRIQLTVAPVFLPGGSPLLPRFVPSASLRLVEASPQGSFVRVTYDVVR